MKLPFEYLILGVLMECPMHGYDIHRSLSSDLSGLWYVGMSSMYGMLKNLEADGHVGSTMENGGSRPAKRVFMITENGKRFFREWISRPVNNIRDMRVEFMAKVYFFKDLGLPGGRELVERQRAVCLSILQSIDHQASSGSEFSRLLSGFKTCQIRSIMSWLDECLEFLERSSDNG